MKRLAPMEALFALEYLVDLNGTQAAIRAGYSPATAYSQASRLLRNVKVRQEIDRLKAERAERLGIDADWVLTWLVKSAVFDIRRLYNSDGSLKGVTDLDDEAARIVEGMDVEDLYEHFGKAGSKKVGEVRKYRLPKRNEAKRMIGEHLAMFTQKIQVEGTILTEVAERMRAAAKRTGK